MKRVFLLVIATIYSLLSINANNNDVVIVYRNDGIVNVKRLHDDVLRCPN